MPSQWWVPSRPKYIQPIPWLSPDAIEFLGSIVRPEFEVLEHGSGGSTLWFAARVKHVTALETKPEWAEAVRKNLTNGHTVTQTIAVVDAVDLLLIDGEPVEDRGEWLKLAPRLVKPGGWVVLDNANRPEYASQRAEFQHHADLVFRSKQVFEHLVTEFWRVHA